MTTSHSTHLQLQLVILTLTKIFYPLFLDVQFDALLLLVLDLEDVLLVIFATGSPHEHFVFGGSLGHLTYFRENKRFSHLLPRVVNRIDHLFSVHAL